MTKTVPAYIEQPRPLWQGLKWRLAKFWVSKGMPMVVVKARLFSVH